VRLILVPTANRPECAIALEVAFRLAADLSANVAACHVRGQRREAASVLDELMPEDVYELTETWAAQSPLTSKTAHDLYRRISGRHGFTLARRPTPHHHSRAFWHEMVGSPRRVFEIIGPVADLAVASRPKPKAKGWARAFLLAALLHSSKPVLVAPQRRLSSIGKTIVIAWNQSTDAALAVAAAMPLLQRAERIVVATCGPENRPGPKSSYLGQYLANWDLKIEKVHSKGRNVEKELEQMYRSVSGDLLVMGAYSRPRLQELVFGGVTEHMLFKSQLPVLMLHR
jgi:nucleotide-binding universal stress UspA family protein